MKPKPSRMGQARGGAASLRWLRPLSSFRPAPATVPVLVLADEPEEEAARRLVDDGVATICLTANPKTATSYSDLVRVTGTLREALGPDVALWAGKMHLAGACAPIIV